jgi:hypothetical protein
MIKEIANFSKLYKKCIKSPKVMLQNSDKRYRVYFEYFKGAMIADTGIKNGGIL